MFTYYNEWTAYNPNNTTNYYSDAFEISVYNDRHVFFKKNNGDRYMFPPSVKQMGTIDGNTVRVHIKHQMIFDYQIVRKTLEIKDSDYEFDKYLKGIIRNQLCKTVLRQNKDGNNIPIDGRYKVDIDIKLKAEDLLKYSVDINGRYFLISEYFGFLLVEGNDENDFIDPFDEGFIFWKEKMSLNKDLTSVKYNALRGSIFLVDRNNKYRNLYMNVLGNIARIPITHISEDTKLKDGLYIKDNSKMVFGNGGSFTPISKVDKQFLNNLSIYTSYEECKSNNLELINKQQKSKIDSLTKENNSLKNELSNLYKQIEEDKRKEEYRKIHDRLTEILRMQKESLANVLNTFKSYKTEADNLAKGQWINEGLKIFANVLKLIK